MYVQTLVEIIVTYYFMQAVHIIISTSCLYFVSQHQRAKLICLNQLQNSSGAMNM